MDMAFLRRAERILEDRQLVRLDHALLVAALAAQQTALTAGMNQEGLRSQASLDGEDDPLIELLNGGPGWRRAACRQRGCFSRAEAGRRGNDR